MKLIEASSSALGLKVAFTLRLLGVISKGFILCVGVGFVDVGLVVFGLVEIGFGRQMFACDAIE